MFSLRLLALGLCIVTVLPIQNFWYSAHDGTDRLKIVSEGDLDTLLGTGGLVVLWVRDTTDQALMSVTGQMMQMTAQHLPAGVFGVMDIDPASTFLADNGLDGDTVIVFKEGRQVIFNGYRSADVFGPFINKIGASAVSLIDGKATAKEFKRIQSIKVVGYFEPTDPAFQAFQDAASEYSPEVPFFVIHDPVVASFQKMNTTGEIHIVKESDKQRVIIPQIPASLDDIRIFLYDNSRAIMNKLSMENLHALWGNVNENTLSVLSFSSPNQALGPPYYKVLKRVARNLINVTNLEITIIQPDQFPMVMPRWEALYNISLSMPALGLVNRTDNNATWFDVSAMQALANETDKVALMQQWFDDILFRVIRVDGLEPAERPQPQEEAAPSDESAEATAPAKAETKADETATKAAETETKEAAPTDKKTNEGKGEL